MANTRKYVQSTVTDLLKKLPREECRTCDCFQGFLTQLEIDSCEDISDIIAPLKVSRDKMHGCISCDPCPPGCGILEIYSANNKEMKYM